MQIRIQTNVNRIWKEFAFDILLEFEIAICDWEAHLKMQLWWCDYHTEAHSLSMCDWTLNELVSRKICIQMSCHWKWLQIISVWIILMLSSACDYVCSGNRSTFYMNGVAINAIRSHYFSSSFLLIKMSHNINPISGRLRMRFLYLMPKFYWVSHFGITTTIIISIGNSEWHHNVKLITFTFLCYSCVILFFFVHDYYYYEFGQFLFVILFVWFMSYLLVVWLMIVSV